MNRSLCLAVLLLLPVLVRGQLTDEQRILHDNPPQNTKTRVNQPQPDELVRPSVTDPEIQTFDDPHGIYFPPVQHQRNQLLLFIPGTQPEDRKGMPQRPGANRFLKNAAMVGYHAVYLMYPNDLAAAEACRDKPDRDGFAAFRWAIIEGGSNAYISIPRAESIENRTIRLMQYLQREHPNQNWGQFVVNGKVAWEKVAVAGQSQGGGHAAIIATRYLVARVLCFGAPKDYSRFYDEPAKWYGSSVTPLSHYFAFNNYQDHQGCSSAEQVQNLHALGIDKAGTADVDKVGRPFNGAHSLFTNWPNTAVDSKTAHGSMLNNTNLDAHGIPIFRPVWRYMLVAPTDGATRAPVALEPEEH